MKDDQNSHFVLAFINSWERHETMRKGYAEFLADEVLWENTGLKPISGRDAVLARVDQSILTWGAYTVVSDCKHTLEVDGVVVVERVDQMIDGKRELFCTVPIMGIFEINPEDKRIIRWSDYYDPKPMLKAMDAALSNRH